MKSKYITTAIDYVNGTPHIGHAVEKVQADALARFYRIQGHDTYFLTGTDEHGQKIFEKAAELGKDVQDMVDDNADVFEKMDEVLQVEYNDFIRTTDKTKHWPSVQKMWRQLEANGDLHKDEYEGLYCVGCEKFLTESELVDGKCVIHEKEPVKLKEENYFFNIGKYTDQIIEKIESGEFEIIPETRKREVLNILKAKEQYVSFSRPKSKLNWGIPVPGDDEHVMYVWCDALTNYISALGYESEGKLYKKFWEEGDVTQVIGKDIARFHTLIWPAMLLSAGVPLPNRIFIHGFISKDGKKLSKSTGNIIDPFDLVEQFGSDPVRYYLLSEVPAYGDGDYSESRFREVYMSDLANGIGNLCSRVTNMVAQYMDGEVEKVNSGHDWSVCDSYVDTLQFDRAMAEIMSYVRELNKLIDDAKPWQLAKSEQATDAEKLSEVLTKSVAGLSDIGTKLEPFLPTTGAAITKALSANRIEKSEALFPRLED
ncbi:MAG: methionine--tRNA ligase [Patescibacteria group bacterium]